MGFIPTGVASSKLTSGAIFIPSTTGTVPYVAESDEIVEIESGVTEIYVTFSNTNPAAASLRLIGLNGVDLGTRSIVGANDVPVRVGEIQAGSTHILLAVGDNWRLLSQTQRLTAHQMNTSLTGLPDFEPTLNVSPITENTNILNAFDTLQTFALQGANPAIVFSQMMPNQYIPQTSRLLTNNNLFGTLINALFVQANTGPVHIMPSMNAGTWIPLTNWDDSPLAAGQIQANSTHQILLTSTSLANANANNVVARLIPLQGVRTVRQHARGFFQTSVNSFTAHYPTPLDVTKTHVWVVPSSTMLTTVNPSGGIPAGISVTGTVITTLSPSGATFQLFPPIPAQGGQPSAFFSGIWHMIEFF